MKRLTILFLLLAAVLIPIKADEQLKNTDFTEGRSHWEGDGESAATANNADAPASLSENNVTAGSGLLLKLSSRDWVKVSQEFRPLAKSGTLTINYQFSDGLTFTDDSDAFKNVPGRVGYVGYMPFDIPIGRWVMGFLDSADPILKYYTVNPKMDTSEQHFKTQIQGMVVREEKAICVAFPPGHGTVTLLHVGLSDQQDNSDTSDHSGQTAPVPQ